MSKQSVIALPFRPVVGYAEPASPFCFFDMRDGYRGAGTETVLTEQSGRYLRNGTSRGSLDLDGAVGTGWTDVDGAFHFDTTTPHIFKEGGNIRDSAYQDLFYPPNVGVLLIWWCVTYDSFVGNQHIFQFGGLNNNNVGIRVQWANALSRHRFSLTSGAGVGDFRNEDVPATAYTTGTKYNMALVLDSVNRTHQFWKDGVAGNLNALAATQLFEDNGETAPLFESFNIGGAMNNSVSVFNEILDGKLHALGAINMVEQPDDLDARIKALHRRNGIPGPEFNGL